MPRARWRRADHARHARVAAALAAVCWLGACADEGATPPSLTVLLRGVEKDGGKPASASEQPAWASAIPAWQAVVARDQLLARRGQRGVVEGIVAGPIPGHPTWWWLVDATEGAGALAIRVEVGDQGLPTGARVAVAGAWRVDEERRWLWRMLTSKVLEDTPVASRIDPTSVLTDPSRSSHAIGDAPVPLDAVAPSAAGDKTSAIRFTVVAAPAQPGDGWAIGDQRGGAAVGVVMLPGERGSFGGHDLRAADERWQLDRGASYWVAVKGRRKLKDGSLLFVALGAPARTEAITAP